MELRRRHNLELSNAVFHPLEVSKTGVFHSRTNKPGSSGLQKVKRKWGNHLMDVYHRITCIQTTKDRIFPWISPGNQIQNTTIIL